MTMDDATGLRVLTLLTMPQDLIERFKTRLEALDAILPGEFRWENSRRLGYSYLVCVYTWYYRCAEKVSLFLNAGTILPVIRDMGPQTACILTTCTQASG